jgi:pyruvate dehydrogenase E2 component (dihydrolipoamide acetyltransferase)
MFGVKHFEAIINPPQAAILTAGAVRRVPVFGAYDRVVPAQLLTATVSADHRVTDGAEVAQFLQELKATLEAGFIADSIL